MMIYREEYLLKRRNKGITAQKIASAIGVSQSLISLYETGKSGMKKVKQYRDYIDSH